MGTLDEKLAYLAETKSRIRHAIEHGRVGDELSKMMAMANFNGTETFRDFKNYIDHIDHYMHEYLMRRFGFQDELFSEGSFFIT